MDFLDDLEDIPVLTNVRPKMLGFKGCGYPWRLLNDKEIVQEEAFMLLTFGQMAKTQEELAECWL
jgi:hypothetical protein